MLFGEIIREARQGAGLSLEKLAGRLGVTKVYVSDVERGMRKPFTQPRIEKVASILGLDAEELSRAAAKRREYVTLPTDDCCDAKVRLAGSLGHVWSSMTAEHAVRVQEVISRSEQ